MRGHFAVGYRHVGNREKGEESSAWLARLGAPRTAEAPCDPCVNPSLPSTCAAPAALNGRPLLFSREEGRREKKVVRGHFAVGVRHVGKREKGEESSAWLARLGAPRTAEAPCDPCVNPSLPSTCAAESPRSTDAHCIVSTHYLLSSPPFSLLILDYSTLLYVVRTVPWFFCRGDSLFSRVWRPAFLILSVPDFLN